MKTLFVAFMFLAACQPEAKHPLTREEKIKGQFSGWDGSHINLTKWIKNNMNDPSSYEHMETRFLDRKDYVLVIAKFRGNNAYGGKIINTVYASINPYNADVMETSDHDLWEERRLFVEQNEYLKKLDSSNVVKKKKIKR